MIKYTDQNSISNLIFKTPFQKELDKNNRWVRMAELLPWDKMAAIYMDNMSKTMGRATVDLRTVMGAMYIQHALNLTDRNTIDLISENIYMQHFVGLSSFQTEAIFDHTLLSIFRQRLGDQGGRKLNEIMVDHAFENGQIKHRKSRSTVKKSEETVNKEQREVEKEEPKKGKQSKDVSPENRGTVKIDATAIPQNITYPTDTKLLNHSRELSESIIDELYEQLRDEIPVKLRTYRIEGRKKWLAFSKSRKPTKKTIRKQKKAQLGYLKRNLNHIDRMLSLLLKSDKPILMTEQLRKKMYVISELYRQQQEMYAKKSNKIKDRIVSISQPWVRPIVRGKAGSPVEFGAKINLSLTEGMVLVDYSSFDAFNEGSGLIEQLEGYKVRFGYYPEYALVDKIYLTRNNRNYMKINEIKHTGSILGRPRAIDKQTKSKNRKKNNERNHIEGKIGQGKQRFGWDKLRTKTAGSSLCAINLIALAMNMLVLLKTNILLVFTTIESFMTIEITKLIKDFNPFSKTYQRTTKYCSNYSICYI